MLVGIDASRSTATRRTGTENYSFYLIRELLSLGTAHRFRLYVNRPADSGAFQGSAEQRAIPFPRLWTHVRLSWEMASRPPDLLFVPSHVLPLVHPARSIVTIHDLGYHYHPAAHTLFQNAYLRWSTRYNARSAARVLAVSEATRRDLTNLYDIPGEKVIVAYPGRDESLAAVSDPALLSSVRARYGLTGPYFLYVGTLQPRKNLTRLIQAFAKVGEDLDPAPQLVLAGKRGWLYEEILAEVERLDLSARVAMPGFVPEGDLAPLLSGALAFVFPSLYEGFGLPVLEAMSCGTPVMCSNVSSLPEVAGNAALLVNPLDVDEMAVGLRRVAADEGLRRTLVERGLRQAQRFSWRRCAETVLRVMEEVGDAVG